MPPVDGRVIKAATFSSLKWAWLSGEVTFVRCSIGRCRDEHELQRDDDELVAAALADLREAIGLHAPCRSTQRDAVGRGAAAVRRRATSTGSRPIRAAVGAVAGLAVCGAAYGGVGIPAVIADAQAAATRVARRRSTRHRDNGP